MAQKSRIEKELNRFFRELGGRISPEAALSKVHRVALKFDTAYTESSQDYLNKQQEDIFQRLQRGQSTQIETKLQWVYYLNIILDGGGKTISVKAAGLSGGVLTADYTKTETGTPVVELRKVEQKLPTRVDEVILNFAGYPSGFPEVVRLEVASISMEDLMTSCFREAVKIQEFVDSELVRETYNNPLGVPRNKKKAGFVESLKSWF